jgi:type VI secretion system protein VasJ
VAAELGVLACCMVPLASSQDARFDAEHERIRAEVETLTGLQEAVPDWPLVERLGSALLATRCKDLTIATFVAAARLERAHWQGLAEGCLLLAGLISTFAAELFPRRSRARRNALSWWVEYLAARIPALPPTNDAALVCARDGVQQVRALASELLGDECPAFGALTLALDRAALAIPPAPAPPEPVAVASTASHEAPSANHPAGPAPESALAASDAAGPRAPELPTEEGGVAAFVRFHGSRLVELARARLAVDVRDARSYRWLRTGVWLGWEHAPAENARGRTALAPALHSARAELERARAEARWEDLVRLSEGLLPSLPSWLDLNYTTALALRELGPAHEPACVALERETRALVARIPELLERKFRDGSGFASSETQRWLRPSTAVTVEADEPLASTGNAQADALMQSLHAAPSARAQFALRCQLARSFALAGQHARAIFVYRGLLCDVDAFALEQWDPALALEVVQPLCALLDAQTPAGVKDADAAALYARLARLAPWLASKREHGPSA